MGSQAHTTGCPDIRTAQDEHFDTIRFVFDQLGMTDGRVQLAYATNALGRSVHTAGNITEDEAEQLIGALRTDLEEC